MRFKFRHNVKPTRIFRRALAYITAHESIPRRVAAGLLVLWLTVTLSADKSGSLRAIPGLPHTDLENIPVTSADAPTARPPVFGEIHFPETDTSVKE